MPLFENLAEFIGGARPQSLFTTRKSAFLSIVEAGSPFHSHTANANLLT
jgi:hypothetical protein